MVLVVKVDHRKYLTDPTKTGRGNDRSHKEQSPFPKSTLTPFGLTSNSGLKGGA